MGQWDQRPTDRVRQSANYTSGKKKQTPPPPLYEVPLQLCKWDLGMIFRLATEQAAHP